VVLLLALGAVAGCATAPYRAHPEFEARARLIKTVALMPPDVKVYRLTAGGVRELMDEWSDKARANLIRSVAGRVGAEARFVLKEFGTDRSPAAEPELQDVRALFEAVVSSVFSHTYRPETTFETKAKRFDYSLGPLPTLAEASGADALLFVYAVDHISTGGRVALNVMTVLLGAAAGVVIIPAGGQTTMVTALVDARTGDLLWFNARGSGGAHDLRDPASAESLAAEVFREFGEIAGAGRRGTGG
jgi:hypothetical protein